jgi:hypothetical protein
MADLTDYVKWGDPCPHCGMRRTFVFNQGHMICANCKKYTRDGDEGGLFNPDSCWKEGAAGTHCAQPKGHDGLHHYR